MSFGDHREKMRAARVAESQLGSRRPSRAVDMELERIRLVRKIEESKRLMQAEDRLLQSQRREGFNRKMHGKGSNYVPGRRVPAVEESLIKEDDLA